MTEQDHQTIEAPTPSPAGSYMPFPPAPETQAQVDEVMGQRHESAPATLAPTGPAADPALIFVLIECVSAMIRRTIGDGFIDNQQLADLHVRLTALSPPGVLPVPDDDARG